MKTIQFTIPHAVSLFWQRGVASGKIVAVLSLLVIACTATISAVALTSLPVVPSIREGRVHSDRHVAKPTVIKSAGITKTNIADAAPTKTEKIFNIIVGIIFPVSFLSLLFYLQYASEPFTGKLFFSNKTS